MVMATLQGVVSSVLLYLLLCAPMAGYVFGRYGGGEMVWFVAVAFFLACMFVTQVCGAGWRSAAWRGRSSCGCQNLCGLDLPAEASGSLGGACPRPPA
jgi:hypothetical protein